MAALANLVRVESTTAGAGTVTLGPAVIGFITPTQAGMVDGTTYSYAIEANYVATGDDMVPISREVGRGVLGGSGTTLTRSVLDSTNGGALLVLTGDQQVIIAPVAEDFASDPLFLTQGLDITATNPESIGNASAWRTAMINTTWTDVTGLNPDFANLEGLAIAWRGYHNDATYTSQTHAKTTLLPISIGCEYNSAGQRFLYSALGSFYGMGDAFIKTARLSYGGGPLPGDEGFGYTSVNAVTQDRNLTLVTVSSVTRALGNTTVTQTIVANKNPQTVTVASTAGMVVGDWYQVQRQVPSAEFNSEAIQIISIGAGTVTALFRLNVALGATLTPALVLGIPGYTVLGQLRVLVNLSGSSYSTGTITAKSGAALQGVGMAWTDNMVGGDAFNVGAISLDNDTYSGAPFDGGGSNGPIRSWYEIWNPFPTQLNVLSFSVAADAAYRSSRWNPPSNYIIRPAVRILRNLGNGLVVCETTSTTWTAGDSVEQAVCPYPDCIGDNWNVAAWTAGATMRAIGSFSNGGPVPMQFGVNISGPAIDQPYGLGIGLAITGADTGIKIYSPVTVGLDFNGVTSGKILWSDNVLNPYIERDTTSSSLNIIYGGTPGTFGGLFCQQMASNLATAEFRASRLGVTGNISTSTRPYIRLSVDQTSFASAATSIDFVQGTPAIAAGDEGFDLRVFGTGTFSATRYSAGTNAIFQCAFEALTLTNGANATKDITKSFQRIAGPTGAFSVQGFNIVAANAALGHPPDGAVLYLYNSTAQAMTISNNFGANQFNILTLTGADVVFVGPSMATLIYSVTDLRWILMSTYH